MLQTVAQDVRYALRQLRRSPGFVVTAVLTLALGIGATTSIFTLAYQVLLRSIPVNHPEQMYKVGKQIECCVDGGLQNDWRIFSYDLYRFLRDETPGTEGMAAVEAGSITMSARRAGDPAGQPLQIRLVSGNYFPVLGVPVLAGRLLRPEDDRQGAMPVAVVSYTVWQTKFHADPALVGSSVLLSGHPVTVVGITAPAFLGERNTVNPAGVWAPLALEPTFEPDRKLMSFPKAHWLDVLVRIKDAHQVPVVQNAIQLELLQWVRANRDVSDGTDAEVARQTTELASASGGINNLRDDYEKSLHLLLLISGFVLLIACANLANLMLVRGMGRKQELSVRSALGAPRARLVRQMLVEAVLLAFAGGVAALAVAYAGTRAILALAMKGAEINPLHASPSLPVLGFAFGLSLVTGLVFGTAPAWIASGSNPVEALRGANRSTRDASALPQRLLVILQTALSLGMLTTAALLILSLRSLQQQDFHFQTGGRLLAFLDLQAAGYQYDQLAGLYRQIDQRFAEIAGVQSFAYATYSPMANNNWAGGIALPGSDPNKRMIASYSAVSPQFFQAVGSRILLGRDITERDTATSTHVAVINQTFVHKFLEGKQPIGQHFGPDRSMTGEFEIIGVAEDTRYGDPTAAPSPMYFTPMAQISDYGVIKAAENVQHQANSNERFKHYAGNLVVQYRGNKASVANAVRQTLTSINPDIAVTSLTSYDEQVSSYFTRQELVVRLTTIFGLLALVLAAVGLYGVTAYAVARRTSEIGVRMALGASRGSVLQMVLRSALLQTGVGVLVGVPVSLLAARLLQHTLYQTSAFQPGVLLGVIALLLLSTLVAAAVPARRAALVDPMRALRAD